MSGTAIVVIVGVTGSIVIESLDFPRKMAAEAGDNTRYLGDLTIGEYRTAVAADVRRFLREEYSPGGTPGYVRWVLTSGQLKKGQIVHFNRTLRRSPRKAWWAVRVVLSVVLLTFGIGSQTLLLQDATERTVRAMDDVKEAKAI